MTPFEILLTIRAVAEAFKAGAEATIALLTFLGTAQGKSVMDVAMNDRARWDSFWSGVGGGIKDLFSGKLFGIKANEGQPAGKT